MGPEAEPPPAPGNPLRSWVGLAFGVACFHVAYAFPSWGYFVFPYAVGLVVFAQVAAGPRQAFYCGLAAGLATVAPWLWFFLSIFGAAGVVLWGVVGVWTGVFALLAREAFRRLSPWKAAALVPLLWTGVEYFRSELYPLRFAWVTPGFAFTRDLPNSAAPIFGVYGTGFLLFAGALAVRPLLERKWRGLLHVMAASLLLAVTGQVLDSRGDPTGDEGVPRAVPFRVAGLQFEGADTEKLPARLDALLASNPDLVVLPEYAFSGPVPEGVRDWCRRNRKYLIAGGMDLISKDEYYNTAFVIGPDGKEVFRQVKSVPIQFFQDGLPAPKQELWDSPWGKIGICICYDLSFTRVVDRLVGMGAQVIVVPTMDATHWGERQHLLHARVAPTRAREYGVPIVRVCSSGISQIVKYDGEVVATAPFPGPWATVAAEVRPVGRGRLPPDRWLAPFATAVAAAWIGWLLWSALRDWRARRRTRG